MLLSQLPKRGHRAACAAFRVDQSMEQQMPRVGVPHFLHAALLVGLLLLDAGDAHMFVEELGQHPDTKEIDIVLVLCGRLPEGTLNRGQPAAELVGPGVRRSCGKQRSPVSPGRESPERRC